MEQKLHTPEGVRDIYNRECAIKLALQKKAEYCIAFIWISVQYQTPDI